MQDLNDKMQKEQKRKEKEELKRHEEMLLELKEQNRLAKKAARKERIARERQEKAEADKLLNQETRGIGSPSDIPKSSAGSIAIKWIEIIILVAILVFVAFNVFSPHSFDQLVSFLPKNVESVWTQFAG